MQDQYSDDLHLLTWISSFVLLIACANVANLMLARGVTQRQQIAVRSALGAQRSRLVQRALVESVLVAVLGGLAGVLVAYGGAKLILHLAFAQDPIDISANPSWVVLGFALAAAVLTGLLFGIAPAWMAAHVNPIDALRGANRSTGQGHHAGAEGAGGGAGGNLRSAAVCRGAAAVELAETGASALRFRACEPYHRDVQRANLGNETGTAGQLLPPAE